MESRFQYHPLIEGLKVNEDGSVVIYNGKVVKQHRVKSTSSFIVVVRNQNISVMKLIAECWHGIADSPEYIAYKIDETKGIHYTNLQWAKRGTIVSKSRRKFLNNQFKFRSKEHLEEFISAKPQSQTITNYLKENKVSEFAFYGAKKRYGVK